MVPVGYRQRYPKIHPTQLQSRGRKGSIQKRKVPGKPGILRAVCLLTKIIESTEGGTRTHTSLRTLDFESSASANSATSAQSCYKKLRGLGKRAFARGFPSPRTKYHLGSLNLQAGFNREKCLGGCEVSVPPLNQPAAVRSWQSWGVEPQRRGVGRQRLGFAVPVPC